MGYGGGYYDGFPAKYDGFSVGAVFPQLKAARLPREKTDVKLSALADGNGVMYFL